MSLIAPVTGTTIDCSEPSATNVAVPISVRLPVGIVSTAVECGTVYRLIVEGSPPGNTVLPVETVTLVTFVEPPTLGYSLK